MRRPRPSTFNYTKHNEEELESMSFLSLLNLMELSGDETTSKQAFEDFEGADQTIKRQRLEYKLRVRA